VVALVIFLTELTSNVATMTTLAPILGAMSTAAGAAPESLLGPAAVAASCAFMLPVATAPNAIVYATGRISISQMIRAGFALNLLGVVIIALIGFLIAPSVL
ncbi:MAG: anion permease, partial [Pseudomonadota bacterium]